MPFYEALILGTNNPEIQCHMEDFGERCKVVVVMGSTFRKQTILVKTEDFFIFLPSQDSSIKLLMVTLKLSGCNTLWVSGF